MAGFHSGARQQCGQQQPVCTTSSTAVLPERPLQTRSVDAAALAEQIPINEETYNKLNQGDLNRLLRENAELIKQHPELRQALTDVATLQANGLSYAQVFNGRTEYFLTKDHPRGADRILYRFAQNDGKVVVGTICCERDRYGRTQKKNMFAGENDLKQIAALDAREAEAERHAEEQRIAEQSRQQAEEQRQQEERQRAQQQREQSAPARYEAFLENIRTGERYLQSDSLFDRGLGEKYAETAAKVEADTQAFFEARGVTAFSELTPADQAELVQQLTREYDKGDFSEFAVYRSVRRDQHTSLESVDAHERGEERARLATMLNGALPQDQKISPEQLDTIAAALDQIGRNPTTGRSLTSDVVLARIRDGSPEFSALPEETQGLLRKVLALGTGKDDLGRHFVWSVGRYQSTLAAPEYNKMRDNLCRTLGISSDRESLDDLAACISAAGDKRDELYDFLRKNGIEDPANASETEVIARFAAQGLDGLEALAGARERYAALRETICDLPPETESTVWALMRSGSRREALDAFLKEHDIKTLGIDSEEEIMAQLKAIEDAQPEDQRENLTGRAQELFAGVREAVAGAPEDRREFLYQTALAGNPSDILQFFVIDSDAATRGTGSTFSHGYLQVALDSAMTGRKNAGIKEGTTGFTSNERADIRSFISSGGYTYQDA